jgi:hypothetical protein
VTGLANSNSGGMGAPGVPQAASMMQTSTIQTSMMQAGMLVIRFQLDGFISRSSGAVGPKIEG